MIENTLNWAFWTLLLAVAVRAACRACFGKPPLASGRLAASLVCVFSLLITGIALRIAYVAPLAIIQDIVAAQQALEGKPLPTTDIEPLIRRALAEERRPAPMETFWPQLRKEEQQEYDTIATRISEQAHPPFMTLFIAPFVYFLGIHGSSLAVSLLSIGCLGVTLVLLCRVLQSSVTTSQKVLLSSVFLSWYPMFWVVRAGQLGALLVRSS